MSLQPFKLVLRERQILSIGESNICMSSRTKRWVCGTQNHSISPNMPVSLSLSTGRKKGKRGNSTTVMNRWSKSLSFLCASNMTSALRVSQVSCSKCTHTHTCKHKRTNDNCSLQLKDVNEISTCCGPFRAREDFV